MTILEVCIYEPIRPVLADWSREVGSRGGVVSLTGLLALPIVEPRLLPEEIDVVQLSGGVIHNCIWWFAWAMVKRGVGVEVVADRIIFDEEYQMMDRRLPAERYKGVLFFGGSKLQSADKRGKIWSVLS